MQFMKNIYADIATNKIIEGKIEIYYDKDYAVIKTLHDSKYYRVSGAAYKQFLNLPDSEILQFLTRYRERHPKAHTKLGNSVFFKKILTWSGTKSNLPHINCPLSIMIFVIALGLGFGVFAVNIMTFTTASSGYHISFWILLNIFFHECGHILFTQAAGREVKEYGVKLNYGFPMFYVDTTDICMAPLKSRIKVSLAGVFINALLALVLYTLLIANIYNGKRLIVISIFFIFSNLIPFMKLDGYYVLQDLLGISNLNTKAAQELKLLIINKRRYFFNKNKKHIVLLLYGLTSSLFYCIIFISVIVRLLAYFYG